MLGAAVFEFRPTMVLLLLVVCTARAMENQELEKGMSSFCIVLELI